MNQSQSDVEADGGVDENEDICEIGDHTAPSDRVEAVQMTIGGRDPPEYAYVCDHCLAKMQYENAKQAQAEREAGI